MPEQQARVRHLLALSHGPLFIACPTLYRSLFVALAGDLLPARTGVRVFSRGGIGYQRQELKAWLALICNGDSPHAENV